MKKNKKSETNKNRLDNNNNIKIFSQDNSVKKKKKTFLTNNVYVLNLCFDGEGVNCASDDCAKKNLGLVFS